MCEIPEHQTPSTAYLEEMERLIAQGVAAAPAEETKGESYPGQDELWQAAQAAVLAHRSDVSEFIVQDLHAHPETAFEEYRSMAVLAELVESRGYVTRRGVYGVETAFESEWLSPGFEPNHHPTVVVMAEYDALPGLGHACGHNVIAAAGVGGFLAAAEALEGSGVEGRLLLQGTPAEEGHSGKEYMLRGGALDGVDAAIMVHGFGYDIASHAWVGRRSLTATFRGVSAHASSQPFMGRNALDAASLAYHGIGLMRQQMPPSDRVHTIMGGGTRPSVIPDEATMQIYVRSLYNETLMDLSRRVDEILRGAALMAGVGVDIHWDEHPMTMPVRNNSALCARWAQTQAGRGRTALPAGVVPETLAASTDFGNVSHRVPGLHPMVKVSPADVALHTEDFARWAVTPQAVDAAVDAGIGLAHVAIDFLADAALRDAAHAEFAALGAVSVADLLAGERG